MGDIIEDEILEMPSLNEAYANALQAAIIFYDVASVEETMWTGWGEQTVPPDAEMRRVKAKQALIALRDADAPRFKNLNFDNFRSFL